MTATNSLGLSSKVFSPSVNPVALTEFVKDAVAVLNLQSERCLQLLQQVLCLNRIVPVALEPGYQRGLPLDAPNAFRHVRVGKLKMPEGGGPVCSQVHSDGETPDCRRGS
jgi:hypothetical protein